MDIDYICMVLGGRAVRLLEYMDKCPDMQQDRPEYIAAIINLQRCVISPIIMNEHDIYDAYLHLQDMIAKYELLFKSNHDS